MTKYLLCLALLCVPLQAAERLPNVIIILADDLGYGCPVQQSRTGENPDTPCESTCGRRNSVHRWTLFFGLLFTITLHVAHRTLSLAHSIAIRDCRAMGETPHRCKSSDDRRSCKAKGYTTAAIGKWHLGWDWPIEDAQRMAFKVLGEKTPAVSTVYQEAWKQVFFTIDSWRPTRLWL